MQRYDSWLMERRDDAQLIERLMTGEESALRKVIELYQNAVYGMAKAVLVEKSIAEEVTQDTFIALWRRPGAFDPEKGSLLGFLLAVARNKAVDRVRREEAYKKARDALLRESSSGPAGDAAFASQVEERQAIKESLMKLSTVQREVLLLAYFGGRTYREVARELDIPEGTAKTRLRDGLARLRQLMQTEEP